MTQSSNFQGIIILDYGSQYTNIIARRIRAMHVYCEIFPYYTDPKIIANFRPAGIILSGGPRSAYEAIEEDIASEIIALNVPILGICYGMQALAVLFGGTVISCPAAEFGSTILTAVEQSVLLSPFFDTTDENNPPTLNVWMSHSDQVTVCPSEFVVTATSSNCPIAAMENVEKKIFAVQFHPEVFHTQNGVAILTHFVKEICPPSAPWENVEILESIIQDIREKVGSDDVILALSGGVDSSVTAALIREAIGDQLTCIFVDTGLIRNVDKKKLTNFFTKPNYNVIVLDKKKEFFEALQGIEEPEQKRQVIGKLFVDIFQEEAQKLSNARWLAQGTIYSDVIESAGNDRTQAHVIKSHHNVGGLPKDLSLNLLEPLRKLFKDEVRLIGKAIGIPAAVVDQHPFPGPGFAIRILGEVTPEKVAILCQADEIFMEELLKRNLYYETNQAFAIFLPVRSVGVVGDCRKYSWVIALRAVNTTDFMTANITPLPFEVLTTVANRITNEVPNVSRVVYDLSGKPPATIEWE